MLPNKQGSELQTVVRALPKLTQAELRMVHSLVRQMLPETAQGIEASQTSPANVANDLEEFYSVIVRWHKARSMDLPPPLGILKSRNAKLYTATQNASKEYRRWLWAALEDRPKKQERMAFLFLGLDLLGDHLAHANVPISVTTIVRNINKLPSIIDNHFPGYVRSGMLRLLIKTQASIPPEQEEAL